MRENQTEETRAGATPGPWRAENDGAGPGIVDVESYGIIAMMNTKRAQPILGNRAANARLIAAAPELLEALQNIEANLTGRDQMPERIISSLRYAKEAIAKAEGRAQ